MSGSGWVKTGSLEAELVERILNGDLEAENEMVSKYHNGLLVILQNKAKSRQLAKEVAQDTWIIVIEKIRKGDLRDASKLKQFIIQIGKNQLIMRFRSSSRERSRVEPLHGDESGKNLSPQEELENVQLGQAISGLFEQLPTQRDKDILKKFYIAGESKLELCEEYSLSTAHFDRVIHRARQRFKKLWKEFN